MSKVGRQPDTYPDSEEVLIPMIVEVFGDDPISIIREAMAPLSGMGNVSVVVRDGDVPEVGFVSSDGEIGEPWVAPIGSIFSGLYLMKKLA